MNISRQYGRGIALVFLLGLCLSVVRITPDVLAGASHFAGMIGVVLFMVAIFTPEWIAPAYAFPLSRVIAGGIVGSVAGLGLMFWLLYSGNDAVKAPLSLWEYIGGVALLGGLMSVTHGVIRRSNRALAYGCIVLLIVGALG